MKTSIFTSSNSLHLAILIVGSAFIYAQIDAVAKDNISEEPDQLFMQVFVSILYGNSELHPHVQKLLDASSPVWDPADSVNEQTIKLQRKVFALSNDDQMRFAFFSALILRFDGSKSREYGINMFGAAGSSKIGNELLKIPRSEIESVVKRTGLRDDRVDAFYRAAAVWSAPTP